MSGPVTVHTIFWAPPGYAFQGSPANGIPTYEGMIQQYFTDLAHDSGAAGTCTTGECNGFTVLPQFGQGTGVGGVTPGSYAISYSAAADSTNATDPYPSTGTQCASPAGAATCVTDGQVQAEVDHVAQSTPGQPRGLNNIWFVFLPPGVDECIVRGQCGTSAFAGYHSASNESGHGVTIYALVVDPIIEIPVGPGSDPEGYPDAEAAVDVASHETMEAITDPEGTGWMDPNGFEVGDKCEAGPQVGTPLGFSNGSPYNQVINGHVYLLQQEWANSGTSGSPGCVQASATSAVGLPLPQVNLRQFNSVVTGNVNRVPGGGIGVRVSLLRANPVGNATVVARASTTTAPDGSWSVSLAPHAPGDDRDEIDIDYSGPGAPQPSHQVIRTGNGGDPFSEAGWTGWLALDNGVAVTNSAAGSSVTLAPCFQAGLLSFAGVPSAISPTDTCNTQTDSATVSTASVTAADKLTVTSNDNRAFGAPEGPSPNPLGGLVSLTVPVGEPGSVSQFDSPLAPLFTPGGLANCTVDLELEAALCTGLVPGAEYKLQDGSNHVSGVADKTGTIIEPLAVRRGDVVTLSNRSRVLTVLHVAHLRLDILGEETFIAGGSCQPGDYFGAQPADIPSNTVAGLPTSFYTGGVALTGTVCPTSGHAAGLPVSVLEQTDDLSGGQTETEVPDIEDTSPIEGETMYGRFTAVAESGLSVPGNFIIPTDAVTRISLRIATAELDQTVFIARGVDTRRGVSVPALAPGTYTATWLLVDLNGDRRAVVTRFIEQAGRVGAGPKANFACSLSAAGPGQARCSVTFPGDRELSGSLRARLSSGAAVVALGHGAVRRGAATITMKVLASAPSGSWHITAVLSRPHIVPVMVTVGRLTVS
jgi:hypothetical protein